jgi:hypothetical protein
MDDGINWHHDHISEDTLTAFAFRCFHYVPEAFHLFWQRLLAQNRSLPELDLPSDPQNYRFLPWQSWEVPEEWR